MAVDEPDAFAHDAIGHRDRLPRIAGIVLDVEHDAAAAHTPGGIDGLRREASAGHHLIARRGYGSGPRHRHGDAQVLRPHARAGHEAQGREDHTRKGRHARP